jgi:hypothetical protein
MELTRKPTEPGRHAGVRTGATSHVRSTVRKTPRTTSHGSDAVNNWATQAFPTTLDERIHRDLLAPACDAEPVRALAPRSLEKSAPVFE